MVIQSHKGAYCVHVEPDAAQRLNAADPSNLHVIIDGRVAELYATELDKVLAGPSVLRIEATESAKSLERFPSYVEHLVAKGLRRDHRLVAMGGGIIQDITCFLAATMLRGVPWTFYPTTLLAQCDSCIGSKSSINCGAAKNILGTFTPPSEIHLSTRFLATLDERDIRSGIGEMLKVHAIAGPEAFTRFAAGYDSMLSDPKAMEAAIRASLEIKKGYIEKDEFDTGPRLVFNLGHSFGHAMEAATDFSIPHGIAVTIGLDMANWMSWRMGIGTEDHWRTAHGVLARNYQGFEAHPVPLDRVLAALAKDKKNTGAGSVTLILPDAEGRIVRGVHRADDGFKALCGQYLEQVRCIS
ncbi:3-dehydroquinate synthetase [Paramagnetospirillum caucaseum]|uniref:3-dehydroquinate synthetase n=2 Tax=Paramagnetospirillum caucaseum TaxID=1244869 RepID=M2Z890_9PROT|nr:3-dehydroquinate synthetase [Paramagnetospirillum caucaseum]